MTAASGQATCGLIGELTDLVEGAVGQVGRDACLVCCRGPVPSATQINPVIASLLSKVTSEVIAVGGRPGCDVAKATALQGRALHRLDEVSSRRGSAEDRKPGPPPPAGIMRSVRPKA